MTAPAVVWSVLVVGAALLWALSRYEPTGTPDERIWVKHETVEGAKSLEYQIHVVCSAAGGRAYWINVDDLLRKHGAGAWWLMRTDDTGDLDEAA